LSRLAALGLRAGLDRGGLRGAGGVPAAVRRGSLRLRGRSRADRPVSGPGGSGFTTEAERDNRKEAQTVMDLAAIQPGMTVADIGAGEGYYTVRLAARVGAKGRVLAQDIDRRRCASWARASSMTGWTTSISPARSTIHAFRNTVSTACS
jgi:predicted methyltransferase